MKALFILLFTIISLSASMPDEKNIKKQIARMLVVGFESSKVDEQSQIIKDIRKYNLGGVILFDRFYKKRSVTKNISSPSQLKALTLKLQKASKKPLIISIDQEGGKVQRLKKRYGFLQTPSAKNIASMGTKKAFDFYKTLASQLKENGINTNFAPVVDLSLNKDNIVINKLERSYGSEVKKVVKYASSFISAQNKENIISVLKHFPGHGSSLGDSHKGFVDITNTWNKKELEPYKTLINSKKKFMIMTAHVYNKNLDENYPATLSYKINTSLLRDKLGFKGVIISDDLQMKAISKHYKLNEVVKLAINAGVNILLFGNQLEQYSTKKIIDTIYEELKKGNISYEKILESNKRIDALNL